LLARHLDVRIQARGTATLSSSVQQVLGHRLNAQQLRDVVGPLLGKLTSQRGEMPGQ